jgi:hypothetical protein
MRTSAIGVEAWADEAVALHETYGGNATGLATQ